MLSNDSRVSVPKGKPRGKRPKSVSLEVSSGPTPSSRNRSDRPSANRDSKRKKADVGRSSSPISISSDDSPVKGPVATRATPTSAQSSTNDSALREVLRTAFDANARLSREHETEIRKVKLNEKEATDRAAKLQHELREAETALAKLQEQVDECVADRATLFEELETARNHITGAERKLEAALARVGDLEREVNTMCDVRPTKRSGMEITFAETFIQHAELLRIELGELESVARKHEVHATPLYNTTVTKLSCFIRAS